MRLLQEPVTERARKRPTDPAVVAGDRSVSYGELEAWSNRLAQFLRERGCERGDRVAFLMPKCPEAIMAILGILKADCAYVPLDAASPAPRLAKIVRSCDCRWILAREGVQALLDGLLEELGEPGDLPSVLWLEPEVASGKRFARGSTLADLASLPDAPPPYANGPGDPAYIFYTSGSTGTPKGVLITHSNVAHFVHWANSYFGITSGDRMSCHSPLHFDLSTYDIFGSLSAGAAVHLVPRELNLLPNRLREFIGESRLTVWFSVPSVLTQVAKLDTLRKGDFPGLRHLLWCGEVLPTPTLIHWMERLPHVTFTNLYGPTEATVASSYYTLREIPGDERSPIPIGRACDGEELMVLDADMRPTPLGETGDLYIGGVGLSPGYWRDPERTAEAFREHPSRPGERVYRTGDLAKLGEDGLVYFLGRADSQIKSRGYRIELGEIEAALNALDCLRESAVVAVESGGFEGAAICCAYVAADGRPLAPSAVRSELMRHLPTYMLPARWMTLESLPRNASYKIDRGKLTELFRDLEAP